LAVSRSSPRISAGTPNLASIRLPGAQNGQKSALVMRFRRDRGLRGSDNFSRRIFPPISGIQGPRRLRPSSPSSKNPQPVVGQRLLLRPTCRQRAAKLMQERLSHRRSSGCGPGYSGLWESPRRRPTSSRCPQYRLPSVSTFSAQKRAMPVAWRSVNLLQRRPAIGC
jgi:hypothetical protein